MQPKATCGLKWGLLLLSMLSWLCIYIQNGTAVLDQAKCWSNPAFFSHSGQPDGHWHVGATMRPQLILLGHLILEISQIITEPNVCRTFLGEKIAQILFGVLFLLRYSKKQNHFISKTNFFLASCISWNVTLQQNSWAQACCLVVLRKTSSRFSLYIGWNTHFYFISSSFE